MKGRIAEFSAESNAGVIIGEDGNRYQFNGVDWKGERAPALEAYVQFGTHGFQAKGVTPLSQEQTSLGAFQYYLQALQHYANFQGRARRREYWYFALFNFLFYAGAMIVDLMLGTFLLIYMIYVLAVFIPSFAVGIRRLHDVNKSGWFMLILLIPLIGAIWLFILAVTEGDRCDNQYGPDPKEAFAAI